MDLNYQDKPIYIQYVLLGSPKIALHQLHVREASWNHILQMVSEVWHTFRARLTSEHDVVKVGLSSTYINLNKRTIKTGFLELSSLRYIAADLRLNLRENRSCIWSVFKRLFFCSHSSQNSGWYQGKNIIFWMIPSFNGNRKIRCVTEKYINDSKSVLKTFMRFYLSRSSLSGEGLSRRLPPRRTRR